MTRSDMVCSNCVKFDGKNCRLDPEAYFIKDPLDHWCAQGQWTEWSERFQEPEPYFWGEWDNSPMIN